MRTLNRSYLQVIVALATTVFATGAAFGQASATAQVNGATAAGAPTAPVNVDNSAMNKRDQARGGMTADQQTSGTSDTEITRQIRRALIADKELSVYAHNLKIITASGVVTLKGPVKSADEKTKAVAFAKSATGVSQVRDQITIKQ